MKPTPPPFDLTDDEILLALAGELRRLANGLVRSVRRNEVLPSLSELSAMRPLQAMLAEALSSRMNGTEDAGTPEGSPSDAGGAPGYL
jgi:hypothetical protein